MTTGKPNDISEDAWDAARERVAAILVFTGEAAMTEIVARAILAERERCAGIAEANVADLKRSGAWGDLHLGAGMVAIAIRAGS